jgi:hypothetical protein
MSLRATPSIRRRDYLPLAVDIPMSSLPHHDQPEVKSPYDPEVSQEPFPDGYQSGNTQDHLDMARLGKKQEFKRNFSFLSTLGFISIYMATWEFVLVSLALGLVNGGFGGLFWTFIVTVIFYGTVVASLAEMCSMAPTSTCSWRIAFIPNRFRSLEFSLPFTGLIPKYVPC